MIFFMISRSKVEIESPMENLTRQTSSWLETTLTTAWSIDPELYGVHVRLDYLKWLPGALSQWFIRSSSQLSLGGRVRATLEKTSENVRGIEQLQDAILEAGKRGILMFCAASDQGSERDTTYPGAANTTEIFKIGAAGKWGNASKMVGTATTIDYLFAGEKVAPHRRSIDLLKNITLSGSSIATVIASGLAAMILFCVQVAAVDQKSSVTDGDYDQVKRYEGMGRAFDNIGWSPSNSPKYLQVWQLFGNAARKGDPRDENGKIQVIVEVAATLVKGTKFECD
ncbi:hypothetical protein PRZ48_009176 [Zasmidium cellare]|uniref:Peptidase S8/S53 domain-containing protein n=1 Tax=Zasmidium cellare TaxID=395010 RepID=A0ABR0EBM8_ZASCE|nr:hypothetical protein PRZ48_009176 [Zasmidium cellare]